jgi:hypothetical protein
MGTVYKRCILHGGRETLCGINGAVLCMMRTWQLAVTVKSETYSITTPTVGEYTYLFTHRWEAGYHLLSYYFNKSTLNPLGLNFGVGYVVGTEYLLSRALVSKVLFW